MAVALGYLAVASGETRGKTWVRGLQGLQSNLCLTLSSLEIVDKVQSGEIPPFRPTVSELITKVEELRELMKQCWVENPELRPDFQEIRKIVNKMLTNKGM